MNDKTIKRSNRDWRQKLTPEQYHVLREKGTDPPFIGEYVHNETDGMYHCAGCGAALFSSDAKYDSGSGWPSFFNVNAPGAVRLTSDDSGDSNRIEVACAQCGGHLGHVFDDGPEPTGKRYCINSSALTCKKK